MDEHNNQIQEEQFIDQLAQKLKQDAWQVDQERNDGLNDLVVYDPGSRKRICIEFKEAGQYGELPISSIIPFTKQKNRIREDMDKIFLVSFSAIPDILFRKLDRLGIKAFTRPSVDDVAQQVQYAMSPNL